MENNCSICDHQLDFGKRFPHKLECGHMICDICYNSKGKNHNCVKEIELNKKISEVIKGNKLCGTTSVDNEKSRSISPLKPQKNEDTNLKNEFKQFYEVASSIFRGSNNENSKKENTTTLGFSGCIKDNHCQDCENPLNIICIPCKSLICMVCSFIKHHKNHAIIEVAELEKIYKKRHETISDLTKKFTKKLNTCSPKLKIRNVIYDQLLTVQKDIKSVSEKLKISVQNWEERSLKKVDQFLLKIDQLTAGKDLENLDFHKIKQVNKKWKEELFDLKNNSENSKEKIHTRELLKLLTKDIRTNVSDSQDLSKLVMSEFSMAESMLKQVDIQDSKLGVFLSKFCSREFKKPDSINGTILLMNTLPEFCTFPDIKKLQHEIILNINDDIVDSSHENESSGYEDTLSEKRMFMNNFGGTSDSPNKKKNRYGKENENFSSKSDLKISPIDHYDDLEDNGTIESVCKSITPKKSKKLKIDIEEDNIFLSNFKQPLNHSNQNKHIDIDIDIDIGSKSKSNNNLSRDFNGGRTIRNFVQKSYKNPFKHRKSSSNNPMQFSLNFSQRSEITSNGNMKNCLTPNAKKTPPVLFKRQVSQKKSFKQQQHSKNFNSKINLKMSLEASRLMSKTENRNPSKRAKEVYKKMKSSGSLINLRKSKIDDETLAYLYNAFKELPSGVSIDLSYNRISDIGLDILIRTLKGKTINVLNLSYNLIKGSVLQKLSYILEKTSKLKISKEIDLRGNDLQLADYDIDIEGLSTRIII